MKYWAKLEREREKEGESERDVGWFSTKKDAIHSKKQNDVVRKCAAWFLSSVWFVHHPWTYNVWCRLIQILIVRSVTIFDTPCMSSKYDYLIFKGKTKSSTWIYAWLFIWYISECYLIDASDVFKNQKMYLSNGV